MEKSAIKDKILILLENSIIKPSENYSRNVRVVTKYGEEEQVDEEIVENPQEYDFVNSQVLLLKQFFLQLSAPDKKEFKKILLSYLKPGNSYGFFETAFNTLIHIGFFEDAFSVVVINLKNYQNKSYIRILFLVSQILKYEWNTFNQSQIKLIHLWASSILDAKNKLGKDIRQYSSLYEDFREVLVKIYRQLNILKTKSLEESIHAGINLEINEDAKVLKDKVILFGFPPDLSETLDKIDQKFLNASDGFDFKGCMDLIRSFSERLYRSIAIALDDSQGKKVDEKDSKAVANFFQEKQLISDDQRNILIALRHFLSNSGSHRLKSKPEDARLSRNMMIEFGLYLLLRLEGIKRK